MKCTVLLQLFYMWKNCLIPEVEDILKKTWSNQFKEYITVKYLVDTDKTYAHMSILIILFQLQVLIRFSQPCDTSFHALPFLHLCQE